MSLAVGTVALEPLSLGAPYPARSWRVGGAFEDVVGLPVRSRAGRLRSATSAQHRAGGRRVTRRAETQWRSRKA